jgi:hemin uptake protein HemP
MQNTRSRMPPTSDPNQQDRNWPSDVQQIRGSHTQVLNSQDLLRGQKAVSIEHNGEHYRLQNTRAGKLILTK